VNIPSAARKPQKSADRTMRLLVRRPAHPSTPPAVERLRKKSPFCALPCGGHLGGLAPIFENARWKKLALGGDHNFHAISANQEQELKIILIHAPNLLSGPRFVTLCGCPVKSRFRTLDRGHCDSVTRSRSSVRRSEMGSDLRTIA